MLLSSVVEGRARQIIDLYTEAFTASEGAEEGVLIGELAASLLQDTSAEDIRVYIAEDANALIGAGIFTRLTYAEDSKEVFILAPMAVTPRRQKQGVGQALLAHALKRLRDEGVDVALTYGDPKYYGQVGFEPITEEQARPPLPLSHPHGWIGQSLKGDTFPGLKGPSRCVSGLNRADVW